MNTLNIKKPIDIFLQEIISLFNKYQDNIISAYLYGSSVYNCKNAKDIDLLIILKNQKDPIKLLDELDMKIKKISNNKKLDLNYVFESELSHNLSGQKSTFYYLYIMKTGKLFYGLEKLNDIKYSEKDMYRWIVLLTLRARHFYFNNLEIDFWVQKFRKWTIYALAEVYYYQHGEMTSDLKILAKKFVGEYGSFDDVSVIFSKYPVDARFYLDLLERLRVFVEREILHIPEQTSKT